MFNYVCKHCGAKLTPIPGTNLWRDNNGELSKYCYVDPAGSSRLHELSLFHTEPEPIKIEARPVRVLVVNYKIEPASFEYGPNGRKLHFDITRLRGGSINFLVDKKLYLRDNSFHTKIEALFFAHEYMRIDKLLLERAARETQTIVDELIQTGHIAINPQNPKDYPFAIEAEEFFDDYLIHGPLF